MFTNIATANELYQGNEANKVGFVQGSYIAFLNERLDACFQTGTVSLPNVDITTVAGTLNITITSNPSDQALEIATKVSQYWQAAIATSGSPVVFPIVSVSNTAASIIVPLHQAIIGMLGDIETNPPYLNFVDTILTHVKTIVWTVTEVGASTATHSVTIS